MTTTPTRPRLKLAWLRLATRTRWPRSEEIPGFENPRSEPGTAAEAVGAGPRPPVLRPVPRKIQREGDSGPTLSELGRKQ